MTRYAKFKGNTHRQEQEASSWGEQLSAAKQISKNKIERTEQRRLKRQEEKKAKMVCFNCRRPGHNIHDCPEKTKGMEHNLKNRVCFVCGKPGHRAAQCSHNPRGLYPDGGGCKFCGDVTHLYAACPKKLGKEEEEQEEAGLATFDPMLNTEVEIEHINVAPSSVKVRPKGPKIVRF